MKKTNITNVMHVGAVALLLFLPFSAVADTVVRVGESVSVRQDQTVQGDLYVATEQFSHSGQVDGDELVLTGTYTNNGRVAGDVLVVGGSIQHHASVTDDVRILGGDITISEYVGGDVFVLGGVLRILSTATIEGDVTFFGGEADLRGEIGGSVQGMADTMRIDATVAGDVDVTAPNVTLGETAAIAGDVRYVSGAELVRSQSASVAGDTVRNEPTVSPASQVTVTDMAIRVLIASFAALVLYLLTRPALLSLVARTIDHPTRSLILGLGGLLVLPVVAVLLLATVLGALVGVLLLLGTLFVYVATAIVAPVVVGAVAQRFFGASEQPVGVFGVIAGVILVQGALLIPILGPLAVLGLFVFTLGGTLYFCYERLQ